jgi:hypothetical protein
MQKKVTKESAGSQSGELCHVLHITCRILFLYECDQLRKEGMHTPGLSSNAKYFSSARKVSRSAFDRNQC